MAKTLLLFGLLAVFLFNAAQADFGDEGEVDSFKQKINAVNVWVVALLKKFEKTPIREWSITRKDARKQYTAVLNNLSLIGPSCAYVKKVDFDPELEVLNLSIEIPKIIIKGRYKAIGVINGKQLDGQGKLHITFTNITILAKLKLSAELNDLVVDNYDLSYTIGNANVHAKKLKLQGISFRHRDISKLVLEEVRKDAPRLGKVLSKVASVVSDSYIAGLGLQQTLAKAKAVFESS